MSQLIKRSQDASDRYIVPLLTKGYALLLGDSYVGESRLTGHLIRTVRGKQSPGVFLPICYLFGKKEECYVYISAHRDDTSIWIGSASFDISLNVGLAAAELFAVQVNDQRLNAEAA